MASARASTRSRHATLLTLLREGHSSVEELAERVGVSASTVRRDLQRLRESGAVARTYGGAMMTPPFQEQSLAESARRAGEAKARIAATALTLVPASGTVFLDAGTTCGALARLLGAETAQRDLTVVTRGLETAVALADSPDVEVIVLGGRVRRLSHGLVGPLTGIGLDRLAFDVAFLGADAVDPARGIGEPTLEEIAVKEQVMARADRSVVLADSAKLAVPATPAWTRWEGGWTLVTEAVTPGQETALTAAGVEVVVA